MEHIKQLTDEFIEKALAIETLEKKAAVVEEPKVEVKVAQDLRKLAASLRTDAPVDISYDDLNDYIKRYKV